MTKPNKRLSYRRLSTLLNTNNYAAPDNIRISRPILPVTRKINPGETVIYKYKKGLRFPTGIVKSKQEVVSQDNRSSYQKRQDDVVRQNIKNRIQESQNSQAAADAVSAIGKLVSPSTYVGAAARSLTGDGTFGDNLAGGTGFNDMTANVIFDVASPFMLKAGIGAGTEFLQNHMPGLFDPYTTFRGSLGYYGNSLTDRILGTYGRRLHLPTKSRMPELFRTEKDGIDIFDMPGYENDVQRGRFPWQNTTTDTVVRDHRRGHWSGHDVVVKNPNMYNPEGYLSTQPSDTFILKGFNNDPFNTSNYTIVSGNTELLKKAKNAGYETLSTPKLRKAYRAIQDAENTYESNGAGGLFDLDRGFVLERSDEGKRYTSIIRDMLKKRGKPTYSDYMYQSNKTGLPITVSRTPFTVPNTQAAKTIGNSNLVFYDKSTTFESELRKSLGIGSEGINIKTRMKQGYTNDFLRKASEDLNRRLYGKH